MTRSNPRRFISRSDTLRNHPGRDRRQVAADPDIQCADCGLDTTQSQTTIDGLDSVCHPCKDTRQDRDQYEPKPWYLNLLDVPTNESDLPNVWRRIE